MELQGTVKKIGETQTFAYGFQKAQNLKFSTNINRQLHILLVSKRF